MQTEGLAVRPSASHPERSKTPQCGVLRSRTIPRDGALFRGQDLRTITDSMSIKFGRSRPTGAPSLWSGSTPETSHWDISSAQDDAQMHFANFNFSIPNFNNRKIKKIQGLQFVLFVLK